MKKGLMLLMTIFLTGMVSAQKSETVQIKTSAECGNCKDRIEGKLNYTKGIVFAELDVPSKVLTVKYKKKKINLDQVRKLVSEIGYDADDIKAVAQKQKALPKCCQPGGMKNEKH